MGGGHVRQVVAHGGATVFEREGKSTLLAEPFFYLLDFCVLEKDSARIVCYSRLGYGHCFINKQMLSLQKQFDERKQD